MSFPSLEKSLDNVSNRYMLVVLAAKRARQLNRGAKSQVDTRHKKPTSTALEEIAEAGFWRIGLAGEATTELKDALGPQRVALVLGAEGPGMRSNTREHCDALAKLPISDAIESLNVSNAAAVALYAASVA